jgi:arylsulfatase A-like enzyme
MKLHLNQMNYLNLGVAGFAAMALTGCAGMNREKPNIVIILTDDQGYADLGCFGGTHVNTPRLDRMAEEGVRLTSFYVAAPLSSPSRAALMTGSYPKRVGMAVGSRYSVLLSDDEWGLNPSEITIAEMLKGKGYTTGIFGKWHLGDQPEFLPTRQGFDEFYGIPYSHDIHPFHPRQDSFHFPPLPLYEGDSVIAHDPDADFLTRDITREAVSFIDRHSDGPFFLYVPHPMPHTPIHVTPETMEKVADSIRVALSAENGNIDYDTRNNLYPYAIDEIDWSVGEILDALERNNVDKKTLVIFTSDNGPHVGKATPLRGRKGSNYEGGMREPAIVRWPGRIKAGRVCDELLTSMDLLPTMAFLTGAEVPDDRIIDGRNIWPVLSGKKGAVSPHEVFFYHRGNNLTAVRSGMWKLHRKETGEYELYNLGTDISEQNNVADENSQLVDSLNRLMISFDAEMCDSTKTRPHGTAHTEN